MLTIRRAAFSSSMALKKGGSTQSAVALGFIVDVLHLACFSGNLPQRSFFVATVDRSTRSKELTGQVTVPQSKASNHSAFYIRTYSNGGTWRTEKDPATHFYASNSAEERERAGPCLGTNVAAGTSSSDTLIFIKAARLSEE
ncbi:uncharacterized protein LOC111252942 [Varroa destructor]|uniref:Uncharacterized protein n=1 Tax=Varroa destructor TaxID=109461 RepID=A0A7M7KKZ4_VARDE|nr:uncharacterized protein LOC111252942 [Varroa destructor]